MFAKIITHKICLKISKNSAYMWVYIVIISSFPEIRQNIILSWNFYTIRKFF